MRLIAFAIYFSMCGIISQAQASDQISDAVYLRKLSFHIKGTKPTPNEYDELNSSQDKNAFFNQKIAQYLNTIEAQDRMVYRLSEKFQVRPPNIGLAGYKQIPQELGSSSIGSGDIREDSMTDLFRRLSAENLSWDALLTAKNYNLYASANSGDSSQMSDFNFFRLLYPALPQDAMNFGNTTNISMTPVPVQFNSDEPVVGGVLTTPRFLSRYNTTNLNKNRRRAAAVFRIFLCDPMFPIIPPPPDKKAAELDQAFQDSVHGQVSPLTSGMTISDSARHGSDPNCAACHNKLDPMGLTFQNIGIALNPIPAPGYLTFTRADGEKLKTYLRGVGDLGREVTKQPEYVSCQIDWFWKQFIGQDVSLSTERKAQIAQAFEKVGRRTNDFIKVLVTTPEFRQRPQTVERISFTQVAPLLKRCDSCHTGEYDYDGDTLSTPKASHEMLKKMLYRLTLADSSRKKMPQDWTKWDTKDLETVKRWLREGAVDDQGTTRLTPTDLGGVKWNN